MDSAFPAVGLASFTSRCLSGVMPSGFPTFTSTYHENRKDGSYKNKNNPSFFWQFLLQTYCHPPYFLCITLAPHVELRQHVILLSINRTIVFLNPQKSDCVDYNNTQQHFAAEVFYQQNPLTTAASLSYFNSSIDKRYRYRYSDQESNHSFLLTALLFVCLYLFTTTLITGHLNNFINWTTQLSGNESSVTMAVS